MVVEEIAWTCVTTRYCRSVDVNALIWAAVNTAIWVVARAAMLVVFSPLKVVVDKPAIFAALMKGMTDIEPTHSD
jgi:hypothetical protein